MKCGDKQHWKARTVRAAEVILGLLAGVLDLYRKMHPWSALTRGAGIDRWAHVCNHSLPIVVPCAAGAACFCLSAARSPDGQLPLPSQLPCRCLPWLPRLPWLPCAFHRPREGSSLLIAPPRKSKDVSFVFPAGPRPARRDGPTRYRPAGSGICSEPFFPYHFHLTATTHPGPGAPLRASSSSSPPRLDPSHLLLCRAILPIHTLRGRQAETPPPSPSSGRQVVR